jgi:hypothetical protein
VGKIECPVSVSSEFVPFLLEHPVAANLERSSRAKPTGKCRRRERGYYAQIVTLGREGHWQYELGHYRG